jgi:3-deoxy-D-manno-octulosonate 8-phosphate phosphatase KdsC-like HAD superfamily phosphatase
MKTIICDVDGTLTKYMSGGHKDVYEKEHTILPGVFERMKKWEAQGHNIILITGRRESVRERTESELRRLGIPFDMLLMGMADTGRILINDIGSLVKAHAVNLERDVGWDNADWKAVGLDNL